MVVTTGAADVAAADPHSAGEPISKEEALKRFLARKAKAAATGSSGAEGRGGSQLPSPPAVKRKDEEDRRLSDSLGNDCNRDDAMHREHKKMKQEQRAAASTFPSSKKSHFDLVPGFQNTTTKEPMRRPPDIRLVTALAARGPTLGESLAVMNTGPSGRETMLQSLTTRDVVMIPDLFDETSGFVLPRDPWPKAGVKKTIYQVTGARMPCC